MKFCETCQNTGSTTPDGDLDCTAPGCEAATQRAEFNTWLLQMGWPEGRVKEWAIYRHGLRTADESAALQMEDLERVLKAGFINANVDLDRLIEAKDAAEKQAFNLSNALGLQAIRINALVEETAAKNPMPDDLNEQRALAEADAVLFGTGFLIRGLRVNPADVFLTRPPAKYGDGWLPEPVTYMIRQPGCVIGLTESSFEIALSKARDCQPGTAVVGLFTEDHMRAAIATRQSAPVAAAAPQGDIEDPVIVPRGLLGAACHAIVNKKDAPNTLEKLRAIILAKTPADAAPVDAKPVELLPLSAHDQSILDDIDAMAGAPTERSGWWKRAIAVGASRLIDDLRKVAQPSPAQGDAKLLSLFDGKVDVPKSIFGNEQYIYLRGYHDAANVLSQKANLHNLKRWSPYMRGREGNEHASMTPDADGDYILRDDAIRALNK